MPVSKVQSESVNLADDFAGMHFGGTAAANALDDYEEGTWTPVITPSGSGTVSLKTTHDTGSYVKIGKIVTVSGRFDVLSVSSPTGLFLEVTGLPFSPAGGADESQGGGGAVTFYDNSASSMSNQPIQLLDGGSDIRFRFDPSSVAANDQFFLTFTYQTT